MVIPRPAVRWRFAAKRSHDTERLGASLAQALQAVESLGTALRSQP